MPSFQYVARNSQGKTVTGTSEAVNESALVKTLKEQGLTPTQISFGQSVAKAKKIKGKGGRTSLYDIVLFSRQMATMIKAGLPLIEVLDILSEQAERIHLKNIIKSVEKDVEAGASLTEALQKFPSVFDTFFLSMIRAGEASGMLDTILEQIAKYLEKTLYIIRKVKAAVTYPITVSIIAACITVFLLVKVVPVFQQIFVDLGGQLPWPTKITVAISNIIQHNFIMAALVVTGIVVFIWQYGKTKTGRYNIDRMKLKIPVFGQLFLKVAIAKFARTLGTLIRAGVNILYALEIVAKTAGNVLIEEAVLRTRNNIQKGESLTKPLAESGIFPPMVTRMIDVGERTGALEAMLNKVADFYEDQVDAMVSALTSLIEPLLIVFLGVVVGFIVISMFMPLFKMVQVLSK